MQHLIPAEKILKQLKRFNQALGLDRLFIANSKNCSFYRSSKLEPEELIGRLQLFLPLTVSVSSSNVSNIFPFYITSANYTFPLIFNIVGCLYDPQACARVRVLTCTLVRWSV